MRKYREYLTKTTSENLTEDWEKVTEDLWKVFKDMKPKINTLDISNVESKDLDKSKPILQFQDSDGVLENICNVEGLEDGLSKMKKIFDDSNFEKHYYNRVVDHDEYYWIDYGSHHCFFRVTKGDK
ncbi:Phage protein [Staphylococcus phage phiSA039]|nr:Phage protein [Staphylococcus phage phiSA039]